jgi:hypothetical protein
MAAFNHSLKSQAQGFKCLSRLTNLFYLYRSSKAPLAIRTSTHTPGFAENSTSQPGFVAATFPMSEA